MCHTRPVVTMARSRRQEIGAEGGNGREMPFSCANSGCDQRRLRSARPVRRPSWSLMLD